MEALLSLSFDNLSSRSGDKIRKGLKQIEGLLAQICLSTTSHPAQNRRASVIPSSAGTTLETKKLVELPQDLAFREFFRLQESFEFNVATHLLTTLNSLLSHPPGTVDTHLASTLTLLQGILLLHPPSRHLFTITASMDTLLDLLDTRNPPAVQQAAVLVLVTALLGNPPAARTFEKVDGLLSIKDLLRSEDTTKHVKVGVMEFLYFYLLPERPADLPESQRSSGSATPSLSSSARSASPVDSAGAPRSGGAHEGSQDTWAPVGYGEDGARRDKSIRSTREKQRLLGQYLSNVDDLVQDLEESVLFA